jgi:hypothetical protein
MGPHKARIQKPGPRWFFINKKNQKPRAHIKVIRKVNLSFNPLFSVVSAKEGNFIKSQYEMLKLSIKMHKVRE